MEVKLEKKLQRFSSKIVEYNELEYCKTNKIQFSSGIGNVGVMGNLDQEVLTEIFDFLEMHELLKIERVCQMFYYNVRAKSTSRRLWKKFLRSKTLAAKTKCSPVKEIRNFAIREKKVEEIKKIKKNTVRIFRNVKKKTEKYVVSFSSIIFIFIVLSIIFYIIKSLKFDYDCFHVVRDYRDVIKKWRRDTKQLSEFKNTTFKVGGTELDLVSKKYEFSDDEIDIKSGLSFESAHFQKSIFINTREKGKMNKYFKYFMEENSNIVSVKQILTINVDEKEIELELRSVSLEKMKFFPKSICIVYQPYPLNVSFCDTDFLKSEDSKEFSFEVFLYHSNSSNVFEKKNVLPIIPSYIKEDTKQDIVQCLKEEKGIKYFSCSLIKGIKSMYKLYYLDLIPLWVKFSFMLLFGPLFLVVFVVLYPHEVDKILAKTVGKFLIRLQRKKQRKFLKQHNEIEFYFENKKTI